MARPSQARQRLTRFFCVEESTSFTLETHAAGDAVRHSGVQLSTPRPKTFAEDADKGVAASEAIYQQRESSLSYPSSPVRASGSVGTAGELDPVLKGLLGSKAAVTSTTVNDTSPTTTQVDLASVSGMQAGDLIWFDDIKELSIIESISGNTVTLAVPLSTAPSNGETVHAGIQYRPADELPTYSCIVDYEHLEVLAAGHVWNEGTVEFPANDVVKFSGSTVGSGKRSMAGTATGSGSLGSSTITLATGHGKRFSIEGGQIRITLDPGGANEESHTVTAVSGDTLTISGTLAATHTNVEISYQAITPTHTGSPVATTAGVLAIESPAGTRLAVPVREASVQVSNGYVLEGDALTAEKASVAYRQGANPREVTWSVTARLTQEMVAALRDADDEVAGAIVIWAGGTAGSIVAAGSLRVQWDVPEIDSGGTGDLVTLTLTGRAIEASDGAADEVRIAMI